MNSSGQTQAPTQTTKRYALIVDDDPAILEVYDMALADMGFTSVAVTDSSQVVDRALAVKPSLIILDHRMPGKTGLELTRMIRNAGFSDVPVILVSAGRDLCSEALAAGASAFLEKPFEVGDLIDAVVLHSKQISAA